MKNYTRIPYFPYVLLFTRVKLMKSLVYDELVKFKPIKIKGW